MNINKTMIELDVDIYDIDSDKFYLITEYNKLKKKGENPIGIEVVDSYGNHIGYEKNK